MPPRSDVAADHDDLSVASSGSDSASPKARAHGSTAFALSEQEAAITSLDLLACLSAPSPATCCLPGQTVHEGTEDADTFSVSSTSTPPRCVLLYGGDDQAHAGSGLDHLVMGAGDDVATGRSGDDVILGGFGNDQLTGDSGHDVVWGSAGDDVITAGSGNDAIRGGFGADHIDAGTGDDWILPGAGQDTVLAGSGNDTIEIRDVCELRPGESIHGGSGTDTLRTPLSSAQLATLGVSLSSVEIVDLVEADPASSECGSCHCTLTPDGTDVVCCGGVGTCKETVGGSGYCACPDGLSGSDCTYDPAEAIGDDPIPPNCQTGDPSCWKLFDGSVEVPPPFHLDDLAACTGDLTKLAVYGAGNENGEVFHVLATYPTPIGQPGVWAPGEFPVVILATANGPTGSASTVDESQYEDLALHLSRNGFIVLVVAPATNSTTVAVRAEITHCLHRLLGGLELGGGEPLAPHHDGTFAYVGHSRGGEAVVVAAAWDEAISLAPPRAIVSLAPTLACGATRDEVDTNCGYGHPDTPASEPEWLYGILANERTPAFLVLGGSADGDTTNGMFGLMDEAFAEPADPVPFLATILASLWTRRVPHLDWRGQPYLLGPGGPGEVGSWGALLARAYTLAFLQWHVSGARENRLFFVPPGASEGPHAPACVLAPNTCAAQGAQIEPAPRVLQFRDGGVASGVVRVPVHSFTAGTMATLGWEGTGPLSTMGVVRRRDLSDGVQDQSQTTDLAFGDFTNLRGQVAQMVAEPPPGGSARIDIGLAGVLGLEPLDAIAAQVTELSFRVAIRVEGWGTSISESTDLALVSEQCEAARTGVDAVPPHAPNDRALNLHLTLRDADGTEATVQSRDHAQVLPSDIAVYINPYSSSLYGCDMSQAWTTVRIPLTAFVAASDPPPSLDLTTLTELSFELTVDDPEHGGQTISILLDSVELVGPYCGDGIIDPFEVCDSTDLAGETCESLLGVPGTLACSASCGSFVTSGCAVPPDCGQGIPGELGCPCLPVDPLALLGADGSFPDGPGSYGTASYGSLSGGAGGLGDYCPDHEASTGHAICGLVPAADEQDSVAACIECAAPGNGAGGSAYGCPCWSEADCAPTGRTGDLNLSVAEVPLTCWGDVDGGWLVGLHGTCLPAVDEIAPGSGTVALGTEYPAESIIEEFVRTIWLCKVPCGELGAVIGADTHVCLFRGSGYAFDFASCVEQTCEMTVGQICADLGGHCGPHDTCRDECDPLENPFDPGQGNPACVEYGYPEHYRCTTWLPRGRCAPPECELDPQIDGPGDAGVCEALVYGNVNPM